MLFFPNVLICKYIFIEPKPDITLSMSATWAMLKNICNIVGEDFPRVGVDIKDEVKDNIFVKKGRLAEVEVLGNCSNSRKGFHKAASHWRLQSKIFAHIWNNICKTFDDNHREKTHWLQTVMVLINSIPVINAQWWISWDLKVLCTDCANTVELCKNKMG